MTAPPSANDRFYEILDELAARTGGPFHWGDPALARRCPRAGVYFFFEPGECRTTGAPRVVRIGTHALTATSKSTLWGRLRQHFGRDRGSNPGGGNHRGSIFRQHVGSALIARCGRRDLLESWLATKPAPLMVADERRLELDVSRHIRSMPFLWLSVPTRADDTSDRGVIERNAIALLSTARTGTDLPSEGWLGRDAASAKVRDSSLWNVNHIDEHVEPHVLDVIAFYVLHA